MRNTRTMILKRYCVETLAYFLTNFHSPNPIHTLIHIPPLPDTLRNDILIHAKSVQAHSICLVQQMYVTDDLPQYSDSPSEPLGQDNVRDS